MKKIFFWYMALSIIFPVLTWGEDTSGNHVKYIPRTAASDDMAKVGDIYGEIVRYRYNPIAATWKACTNNSTIKYNPMTDNWSYVYPGEVLRFNPADNNWDYQMKEKRLRYDMIGEKWFYGYSQPGAVTSISTTP